MIASVFKPSILTQNKEEREMVEGPKIWIASFGPYLWLLTSSNGGEEKDDSVEILAQFQLFQSQ